MKSVNASVMAFGITSLLSFVSAPVQGATLHFDDQTASHSYGFSAKAGAGANGPGINNLIQFEKINGRIYTINNNPQGLPDSTNIQLQNVNNDTVPTDGNFPAGSIGWSFDGNSTTTPTYSFTLFAGGKFYYPQEYKYTLIVTVDGKHSCSVTTNPTTNWDGGFVICHKVPFNQSSRIEVILKAAQLLPESALSLPLTHVHYGS